MVAFRLGCSKLNLSVSSVGSSINAITCLFNNNISCHTVQTFRLLSITSSKTSSQQDRLYTSKHEWIQVNGNVGVVGISHYAQESLGDVVYAQLPDKGTKIEKNDEVGALESVKAASELYSPVSGTILEKNSSVEDTPALINQSCYEKGWLFKVELSKPAELKDLLNEDKYQEFLKTNQEDH